MPNPNPSSPRPLSEVAAQLNLGTLWEAVYVLRTREDLMNTAKSVASVEIVDPRDFVTASHSFGTTAQNRFHSQVLSPAGALSAPTMREKPTRENRNQVLWKVGSVAVVLSVGLILGRQFNAGKRVDAVSLVRNLQSAKNETDPSLPISKLVNETSKVSLPDPGPTGTKLTNGSILSQEMPEYPEEAVIGHIQGVVIIDALIGIDGLVRSLQVVKGNATLVEAAKKAVKKWRFRPYLQHGAYSQFKTRITFNFKLQLASVFVDGGG
jgi:TonB family protein